MATIQFSSELVRAATRYALKKEYRPGILTASTLVIALILGVVGLSVSGAIANSTVWGLLAGLAVAAILVALVYAVGYWQNLQFASRVFRNEGVAEVNYEFSDAGCIVRYKAVETILPWGLLRTRERYGEYEVLGFGPTGGHSENSKAHESLEAMSRGIAGPELLGFPIFCAVPRPRARYVFVPAALLQGSRHVPAV